jgi:hypothetical protein
MRVSPRLCSARARVLLVHPAGSPQRALLQERSTTMRKLVNPDNFLRGQAPTAAEW